MDIINAEDVPARTTSIYPAPFAERMLGREKRALGDLFGLTHFGVNLTTLAPGAMSALLHRHSKQEEFIYIIAGEPTLITDTFEYQLKPGDCVGFLPNTLAHCLVNQSNDIAVYLEVGDRISGDESSYPADDLTAKFINNKWQFFHKNGEPYR